MHQYTIDYFSLPVRLGMESSGDEELEAKGRPKNSSKGIEEEGIMVIDNIVARYQNVFEHGGKIPQWSMWRRWSYGKKEILPSSKNGRRPPKWHHASGE